MAMRVRVGLLALAVTLVAFAGCVEPLESYYGFDAEAQYKNPGVFPGNYSFATPSLVLKGGPYMATDPEVVRLKSTLPAFPEVAGQENADGVVFITMAIWRPANVTEPVPIIIDAGPYYEVFAHCEDPNDDPRQGCPRSALVDDTIDHVGQTTRFSLNNFLPHGYAVVQLAVRGTGTSGGCMDLLGPSEVHDLDQAITWLAEQPWSNGNVALTGVSYDGSTPWEAASTGNPHVKTIVPISGLPDIYDLMFHNGSAETRGLTMHSVTYWGFGYSDGWPYSDLPVIVPDGTPLPVAPPASPIEGQANGREAYQDRQNLLCEDALTGAAMGPYSTATADRGATLNPYWAERDHRQAVLDNYHGSVFLIHGLQDWNVDPHAAIPFNAALRAAGLDVKEWYGQWDHANPDSNCQARLPAGIILPCRLDYADVLLRWYDKHLKGLDVDTGPAIQVQDDLGGWRNVASFPPTDPAWLELRLGAPGGDAGTGTLGDDAQAGTASLDPSTAAGTGNALEFRSAPLDRDVRVSGLAQLRLPFTPQAEGGELAAWLFDEDADGRVRSPYAVELAKGNWGVYPSDLVPPIVAHAQLNLRMHDGGEQPQPLVPGQEQTARVEFEPADIVFPAGHRIVLWVFQGAYPDHVATSTPAPIQVRLGDDAILRLPTVDVDPKDTFPVPGSAMPDRDQLAIMYTEKPLTAKRVVDPPIVAGIDLRGPPIDQPAGPKPPALPAPPATSAAQACAWTPACVVA